MLVMLAVLIASRASCLVLWNPTNCVFFGSHMSVRLILGYLSISLLIRISSLMDSAWSSCGDASSALFRAVSDDSTKFTGLCCWARYMSNRELSVSSPEWREHSIVSRSVTVSLIILSTWCFSLPSWYRAAEVAPICFPLGRPLFESMPLQKMLMMAPSQHSAIRVFATAS